MTKDEALALAMVMAHEQGWPVKRVNISGGMKYVLFGPYHWWVSLESRRENFSARVTISDWHGEIIDIKIRELNPNRGRKPDGDQATSQSGGPS